MYPGTSAFMRFEYPSRLDADVVARLEDIARRAVEAIGFTHGLFNVELFYQPASGRITIIEINPRMAGSSRISTNASMARACGHWSSTSHWAGRRCSRIAKADLVRRPALCSASSAMPSSERRPVEQQGWLAATYPDARLFLDLKHSTSRERDEMARQLPLRAGAYGWHGPR